MSKVQEIMDIIKKMSVLELSELTKSFEEEFGVSPMVQPAVVSQVFKESTEIKKEEEKTEFNIILNEVGVNKISVIKVVRDLTGLGLKEAKELVEGAPKSVKESVSKELADEIKTKLEAAGAKVEIK